MTVSRRDLRLDFFRGLALWFIFIDHVPSSSVGNLTFRNFGFSDATEIFVFISGYTAAIVYGGSLRRSGFVYMLFQVLKRSWQLYVAHILLFVFFIAQITWVSTRFDNASFVEELNVIEFLEHPQESIIRALILRYRPVNLDVLPLYMALLAGFPLCLWLMNRSRALALLVSILIWAGVQRYHWAVPVYEAGDTWLFNPLGWQLLFVIGALCASARDDDPRWLRWRPWLGWAAGAGLLFALFVTASWKYPPLNDWVEVVVGPWLYPIDKSNLGIARLLHFLAVAYLVAHFVPEDAPVLNWPIADPIIRCGQHALYIFCVSISLSFVAHFVLVQFGRHLPMQLAVTFGGLGLMSALAYLLHWLRNAERAPPSSGAGYAMTPPEPDHAVAPESAVEPRPLITAFLLAAVPPAAQGADNGTTSDAVLTDLPTAPAAPAGAGEGDERCQLPPDLVPQQEPLPGLKRALLDARQPLTIVVLGSLSGAARPPVKGVAGFPPRLQARLHEEFQTRALEPAFKVETVGRTRALAGDLAALVRRQVLPLKPALVIWQVGRADARQGNPPHRLGQSLSEGLEVLRQQGIDTILADIQFHPQFEALYRTDEYRHYVRWIAGKYDLPLLRRYEMIQHWASSGLVDLDSASDDEQQSAYGFIQECLALQAARMIAGASGKVPR